MTKKTLRTLDQLAQVALINQEDLPALTAVVEEFSLAIPDQVAQLIDKTNPHDPIAKQFVPSVKELKIASTERSDPVGDEVYTMVKGVVHRYPDRCLLTPVHVCPVYCRFCFRREKVGHASETLSPAELEAAFNYIEQHKEIWEVILTGGDPLILKPAFLKSLLEKLAVIKHVEVIRIHTRIPMVESHRINAEMMAALKCEKPIYIAIHANHPREFTSEAKAACAQLADAGIPLLGQTVLLKDINDNIDTLSALMRCFIKNRIKPYYLHHAELAKGTQHFRTTIAAGQHLMKQLRGRFSGLCQPTYVLDIPGGYGKMPVGPIYLEVLGEPCEHAAELRYCVEDYHANKHIYPESAAFIDPEQVP